MLLYCMQTVKHHHHLIHTSPTEALRAHHNCGMINFTYVFEQICANCIIVFSFTVLVDSGIRIQDL